MNRTISKRFADHEKETISERFLGRGKGWEYTYQVTGSWPFPTDMLRYDDAVPATDADKDTIDRLSSVDTASLSDIQIKSTVTLKGSRRPTPRRWQSFLWRVVE